MTKLSARVSVLVAAVVLITACGGAGSSSSSGGSASAAVLPASGHAHPNTSSFTWESQSFSYTSAGNYAPTVSCPSGQHTAAGGYQFGSSYSLSYAYVYGSYPVIGQNEWRVNVTDLSNSATITITVYASCTTS
jgi:hypothetical protein